MRPEPKPRRNGLCIVCKKRRPVLSLDAFCSTVCCRSYFGTTLVVTTSTSKPT
jgi:hypothetical protein